MTFSMRATSRASEAARDALRRSVSPDTGSDAVSRRHSNSNTALPMDLHRLKAFVSDFEASKRLHEEGRSGQLLDPLAMGELFAATRSPLSPDDSVPGIRGSYDHARGRPITKSSSSSLLTRPRTGTLIATPIVRTRPAQAPGASSLHPLHPSTLTRNRSSSIDVHSRGGLQHSRGNPSSHNATAAGDTVTAQWTSPYLPTSDPPEPTTSHHGAPVPVGSPSAAARASKSRVRPTSAFIVKPPVMKRTLAIKQLVEITLRQAEEHQRVVVEKHRPVTSNAARCGKWRPSDPVPTTTEIRASTAQGVRLVPLAGMRVGLPDANIMLSRNGTRPGGRASADMFAPDGYSSSSSSDFSDGEPVGRGLRSARFNALKAPLNVATGAVQGHHAFADMALGFSSTARSTAAGAADLPATRAVGTPVVDSAGRLVGSNRPRLHVSASMPAMRHATSFSSTAASRAGSSYGMNSGGSGGGGGEAKLPSRALVRLRSRAAALTSQWADSMQSRAEEANHHSGGEEEIHATTGGGAVEGSKVIKRLDSAHTLGEEGVVRVDDVDKMIEDMMSGHTKQRPESRAHAAALTDNEVKLRQRFTVRRLFVVGRHGKLQVKRPSTSVALSRSLTTAQAAADGSGAHGLSSPGSGPSSPSGRSSPHAHSYSPSHSPSHSPTRSLSPAHSPSRRGSSDSAWGDASTSLLPPLAATGVHKPLALPGTASPARRGSGMGSRSPSPTTPAVANTSGSNTRVAAPAGANKSATVGTSSSSGTRTALKIHREQGFGGNMPFLGNAAPNAVYQLYNYQTMATSVAEINMYRDSGPGVGVATGTGASSATAGGGGRSPAATAPQHQARRGSGSNGGHEGGQERTHDSRTPTDYSAMAGSGVAGVTGIDFRGDGTGLLGSTLARAADRNAYRRELLDKGRFVSDLAGGARNSALLSSDCDSSVAEKRVAWMHDQLSANPLALARLQQRVSDIQAEAALGDALGSGGGGAATIVQRNMSTQSLHTRTRDNLAASAAERWRVEEVKVAAAHRRREAINREWQEYVDTMAAHNSEMTHSREARERVMTWIHVITLARLCAKLERSMEVERLVRERNLKAGMAAVLIQARFRGKLWRRWVLHLKEWRHVFCKFVWRWRLRRGIQRKRRAAARILLFVTQVVLPHESSHITSALHKYIRFYRYCVIRAQRLVKSFLVCQRARMEALRRKWHRVRHELARAAPIQPSLRHPRASLTDAARVGVPMLALGSVGGGGAPRPIQRVGIVDPSTGKGVRADALPASSGAGTARFGTARIIIPQTGRGSRTSRLPPVSAPGGVSSRRDERNSGSLTHRSNASGGGGPPLPEVTGTDLIRAADAETRDVALRSFLRTKRGELAARRSTWKRAIVKRLLTILKNESETELPGFSLETLHASGSLHDSDSTAHAGLLPAGLASLSAMSGDGSDDPRKGDRIASAAMGVSATAAALTDVAAMYLFGLKSFPRGHSSGTGYAGGGKQQLMELPDESARHPPDPDHLSQLMAIPSVRVAMHRLRLQQVADSNAPVIARGAKRVVFNRQSAARAMDSALLWEPSSHASGTTSRPGTATSNGGGVNIGRASLNPHGGSGSPQKGLRRAVAARMQRSETETAERVLSYAVSAYCPHVMQLYGGGSHTDEWVRLLETLRRPIDPEGDFGRIGALTSRSRGRDAGGATQHSARGGGVVGGGGTARGGHAGTATTTSSTVSAPGGGGHAELGSLRATKSMYAVNIALIPSAQLPHSTLGGLPDRGQPVPESRR